MLPLFGWEQDWLVISRAVQDARRFVLGNKRKTLRQVG